MRNKISTRLLLLIVLLGSSLTALMAQSPQLKPVAAMVKSYRDSHITFSQFNPFTPVATRSADADAAFYSATLAKLDMNQLASISGTRESALEISFPFDNQTITVEVVQVNLLTEDFTVVTDQSNGHAVPYTPGVYYRGVIRGNENSLVALSFFDDEMMGVISDDQNGNIVIGKIRGSTATKDDYIIYSDRQFRVTPSTSCATIDDPSYAPLLLQYAQSGAAIRTVNCVKMYYEVDHDIYVSSGSTTTGTTNWMTAVHNNVATIYTNDQVNTAISQIFVWTGTDPFTGSTSSARLSSFKTNRPTFNGDVGELVAIDPGGLGGVASTINGMCSSTNKYCYADVDYAYSNFPTYSWTVEVITHEFGHLLGSYHTHNCSWPIGALDNCYTTEGGCAPGPAPTNGGTIMSYCHLTSYGINFNNGFGTYPGNAIRSAIDAASCMTSSCTGGGGTTYCSSNGQNATEEWIQSVQFGSFTNTSGSNGGYGNYTAQTITLTAGASNSFTLTPGFNGGPWNEYFSIWIDYNNDKDFTDAGENVYNSGATTVAVSSSFTVPSGTTGTTRMRITIKYNALASSCESFAYGEVEDYSVTFSAGGGVTYCASKGNNATEEWIDYFKLGSITRTSGSDGGYYNGTASYTTTLTKSTSYTLTYSIGFNGGPWTEYFRVWIDYNHDGDFLDSGEQVASQSSSSSGNLTSTFTVSSTALTGNTRLRISMKYNAYPTSCETFSYGEVEDYTVNIINQMVYQMPAGSASMKLYPNPANNQVTLELSGVVESGSIQIVDLAGKILQNSLITESTNLVILPVADLTPGMYFVRVMDGDVVLLTQKFLKQ